MRVLDLTERRSFSLASSGIAVKEPRKKRWPCDRGSSSQRSGSPDASGSRGRQEERDAALASPDGGSLLVRALCVGLKGTQKKKKREGCDARPYEEPPSESAGRGAQCCACDSLDGIVVRRYDEWLLIHQGVFPMTLTGAQGNGAPALVTLRDVCQRVSGATIQRAVT
jgi:hypothetical protein